MKMPRILLRDAPYVGGFILLEVLALVFSGNARSMHYAALFYVFDVMYFYTMAMCVFPIHARGVKGYLIKTLIVTALIIFLAAVRLFLFVAIGEWSVAKAVLTSRIVIATMLYRALIITGYAGAYWMGMDRNKKANKLKHQLLETENKRILLENNSLLAQINRHTQLNAFNKLYSLVMPHSERATQLVLALSEQEQFSLQSIDGNGKIPLTQEVDLLKNMIQLERLTAEKQLYVDLIEADNDTDHLRIPPKLLVPLLENVFKHGITDEAALPSHIFLSIESNRLELKMHNYKLPQRPLPSYNIGLANVKNRLENFYPNAHDIQIIETEETFLIKLNITL